MCGNVFRDSDEEVYVAEAEEAEGAEDTETWRRYVEGRKRRDLPLDILLFMSAVSVHCD